MKLNKTNLQADKIANLYRAAFYLASGNQAIAAVLIKKSNHHELIKKISTPLFLLEEKTVGLALSESVNY